MIAHGLQMQIMGIRSVLEDFSVLTTGIIMSGYFVGYFMGSKTTPNLVQKVGHIRVFAAFASLASLSALVAVAYVNPIMWIISRFITGISMVSCFVVAEGKPELPQIVRTLHLPGEPSGSAYRRENKRNEDANDRNHDQ